MKTRKVNKMNRKYIAVMAIIFLALAGLAWAVRDSSAAGGPQITNAFASPHLRPGETWKVYLQASDPNGEMKNIVCTIDQPGVGEYPVSITRVGLGNEKELNGEIYLPTSTFDHLDWVTLTLTVQIQDKAGQYSKPMQFHLALNDRYSQESPPPGVFKDDDLGPILIHVHGLRNEEPGFFRHHP